MSNAGYDEWLAALGTDDAFYFECGEGHGSLPPRRVCPHCGSEELTEEPLPETGSVETFTEMHVTGPTFTDDVPYVTAIVDFGPVRLTGVVADADADAESVAIGDQVTVDISTTETTGEDVVVFRPA